nr:hypothetical protein [Acidobacteriota bacterium]
LAAAGRRPASQRAEFASEPMADSPADLATVIPAPAAPVTRIFARVAAAAIWLWPAIALLLLGRLAASHACMSRLLQHASAAGADWTVLVADLRIALGIRRAVAVRVSESVNVPAIVGLWRPTLLLPVAAEEWTGELRRAVVVHELAHVVRWDALAQMTGQSRAPCTGSSH